MKRNIIRLFAIVFATLILCCSITTFYAETIYFFDGYLYTYINNEKVSLYGLDDESASELIMPSELNNRAVVDIRNRAFFENTVLTTVDFSNATNLERIGSFAFMGCINLDGELMIPDTVTTIETAAFQNCTSLDSVVFNASTGIVPNQCFSGCATLSSVTLNDTVTEIGYYAFSNCPNLNYIEIPTSVTSIAKSSFQNDTGITLGVYRNSYALEYAENNGINYIILDPEPTEPPTEPEPTEPPTEVPTEPVTEAPTTEPTQMPTELSGYYLGDVNGDGTVDVIDATLLQRHLAFITIPSEYDIMHGDVDSNGIVSIIDVTLISRYVAKADVKYPVGEWQSTT
ncbi:leucine-rich repeat protein [Ruminococcus sp.]|uniref:leucine-rich repeat protein n=1 Tax=Ruminococcus sp. TaxID=41978 RepID=UPI0038666D30